jgi:capsular exopolysaccharide synthesis family protein
LGLLLGAGAALLLGFTDRRLKTEEAIEALFGLPILGTIPPPARRAGSHDEHVQREAFGLLAANLRYSALSEQGKMLMVTSSSPVEGKTSVTLGLARAFALLGLRVIAIEADLRRPAFARYATLGSSPGLAAVLAGESRLSEALVAIDVETLQPLDKGAAPAISFSLLPTGALPSDPQRVLSGQPMLSTLHIARALADVVIIDTAPVGTVNDAATLLHMVDSTAFVVRLGSTTKDAARRALRVLRNGDVSLAGLIITDVDGPQSPGYYYNQATAPGTKAKPAASKAKPARTRAREREVNRK